MTAGQLVYKQLKDLADGRIYPLFVPESEAMDKSYIVYQVISSEPDNTLDGVTGDEWASVQIDVYHRDYDELLALVSELIARLNKISPSRYTGTRQVFDDGQYRAIIEYEFWQRF